MPKLEVALASEDETATGTATGTATVSFVVMCIDCGAKSSPQPRATLAEDVALCREGFAKYAKGAKCSRCRAAGIPLEARVGWVGDLCKRLGLDVPQPVAPVAPVAPAAPTTPEAEATAGRRTRAKPRAQKPKSTKPKTARTTTSKRGTKA